MWLSYRARLAGRFSVLLSSCLVESQLRGYVVKNERLSYRTRLAGRSSVPSSPSFTARVDVAGLTSIVLKTDQVIVRGGLLWEMNPDTAMEG
jgi:hypothetical protein